MKENENSKEESFFSSVASASQYSDVCDDYEQIMRVSKALGPTTHGPPINNKFQKAESNEINANNINYENNVNITNNENGNNTLEKIEENLDNSNNSNIKYSIPNSNFENSLPMPQDENSSNKNENENLFNEKHYLTSSIKEVENDNEDNINNIDAKDINSNTNLNIEKEKEKKNIIDLNTKNNKLNKSLKVSKKKLDHQSSLDDQMQIKSNVPSMIKNSSFSHKENDIPKNRKINFDTNLYPFDNAKDEEYAELKNNIYIKNSKKEPPAKKVEENKVNRKFLKHKTEMGIEYNKNFKKKPTFEFNKDSRYFSDEINLLPSTSKQMKKRKKNKYDSTNILKKAVLLNGRKGNKKQKQSSIAESLYDQIQESNPNQLPIDCIKFNSIKLDEINLNFLKKYLRRINVESNIKNPKNKFFKTLIELQNFYIDDTSVWVIKINKDGKYLACGCKSGRIKIYEIMGYNYMKYRTHYDKSNVMDYMNFISESPYKTLESHKSDIIDLCWSPFYSNLLLSASFDHSVILWDINQEGNNCQIKNYEHNDIVTCICFNPTIKNIFISGCLDTFVHIWTFDYYNDNGNSLEDRFNKVNSNTNINSEAKMIYPLNKKNSNKKNRKKNTELNDSDQTNNTFSDLNKTNIYFESKNKDKNSFDYFNIEHKVTALAYFPDGSKIAVGTEKGRIYVYNTYPTFNYNNNFFVSQKKLGFFHEGKKVTCIQFIDKIFAIISTSDSYIRLVNMVEGKIIYQYKGYVNKTSMTRAYTDLIDDVIIVGGEDGNCCLWNIYNEGQVGKIKNYEFFKPFAKELVECNLIAPEECYISYIQKILKITNKIMVTSIIINGTSKGRLEILLNIDDSLSK